MKEKRKVLFELNEEELQVLEAIRNDVPEVKSRVDAVRFLIKKYELEVIDTNKTIIKQQEEMLDLMKQMKRALSYTEQNSEIMLDAANTILMLQDKEAAIIRDVYEHPLLKISKEAIKGKITENQQKKHHNKNRRK